MSHSAGPKPESIIYTDGSSGKNGDGGWSALVATSYYGVELSGWAEKTTNNRMELQAAIEGMKFLHEPHDVVLVSDSAYLLNSIKHCWFERWLNENRMYTQRPNLDQWLAISKLLCYHTVKPIKVKGHTGHEHNERVDKLAVAARLDKMDRFEVLYGEVSQNIRVY